MNLLLVGISHKTAPLAVREKFAISEARIPEALRRLSLHPAVEEAVIISTCNRTEFVLRASEDADGMEALRAFIASFFGLSYDDFAPCFFVLRDYEAVRHLFRVASGLDSMVVGEPQILGQVKRAYALARHAGTAGNLLDGLFNRVFNVAKRVRTKTGVGEAPVSVSSAAVELAERVIGELRGKTVMIIGAGEMGELAARSLVSKGAASVFVSNRTYARAVTLAEELRGTAIHFNKMWEAMRHADIVISSTGCPHYIIRREDLEPVMAVRRGHPLLLVDIAMPRDIDPAVAEIPGCTLADIDGLKEAASENLRQRAQASQAADEMIAEEVVQFRERWETLEVVPTIVSLRRHVEQIRRHELARTRGLFGELSPEQEQVLEAVTQALVNKILHTPFAELKQAGTRPDRTEYLGLIRTVFHLEDEPALTAAVVN